MCGVHTSPHAVCCDLLSRLCAAQTFVYHMTGETLAARLRDPSVVAADAAKRLFTHVATRCLDLLSVQSSYPECIVPMLPKHQISDDDDVEVYKG